MALLAVLNDLSYPSDAGPALPEPRAAEALRCLVSTLRDVRALRQDTALVTESRLPDLLTRLSPTWQADGRNRDQRRFLQSLRNRAPFATVGSGPERDLVEHRCDDQPAAGLGTAHLVDGIAVSLALSPRWDREEVPLNRCQLVELDDGELNWENDVVPVRHAASPKHVVHHRAWICEHGVRDLHTGSELWAARDAVLPRLRFLPEVEQQLGDLDPVSLGAVKRLLAQFQAAVIAWRQEGSGPTPIWPGRVTPEHEQRRRDCWAHDPATGRPELFDAHVRYTPGAGRVHFRWDADRQQAVIARVGRKRGA